MYSIIVYKNVLIERYNSLNPNNNDAHKHISSIHKEKIGELYVSSVPHIGEIIRINNINYTILYVIYDADNIIIQVDEHNKPKIYYDGMNTWQEYIPLCVDYDEIVNSKSINEQKEIKKITNISRNSYINNIHCYYNEITQLLDQYINNTFINCNCKTYITCGTKYNSYIKYVIIFMGSKEGHIKCNNDNIINEIKIYNIQLVYNNDVIKKLNQFIGSKLVFE